MMSSQQIRRGSSESKGQGVLAVSIPMLNRSQAGAILGSLDRRGVGEGERACGHVNV